MIMSDWANYNFDVFINSDEILLFNSITEYTHLMTHILSYSLTPVLSSKMQ